MPVIFITGHDRTGMEEEAMRLGATAYLRKSFDEEALLGVIAFAVKTLYTFPMDDKEGDRTG